MTPIPCPFCGAAQEYSEYIDYGSGPPPMAAFECQDCGARGPAETGWSRGDYAGAQEKALAAWNSRARVDGVGIAEGDVEFVREALRQCASRANAALSKLEKQNGL